MSLSYQQKTVGNCSAYFEQTKSFLNLVLSSEFNLEFIFTDGIRHLKHLFLAKPLKEDERYFLLPTLQILLNTSMLAADIQDRRQDFTLLNLAGPQSACGMG